MDVKCRIRMAAAAAIRRYGWVQGRQGNMLQGFCLVGAIAYARGREALFDTEWAIRRDILHELYTIDLAAWNDAPGRTKEQVIAALEACQGCHGVTS